MKLSKKAYYGLRASLALSQSPLPLSIHALAEKEGIPEDYLEKILQILRRAGIVTAKRGVSGGYQLTNNQVNAWEVISALEGPLKIYAPQKGTLPCLQITHCQTNSLFRDIEETLENRLKKIPLQSLSQ